MVRRVAKPLDAVCQDWNCGIAHGGSLHRPSRITDHHLVEREAFFCSANEQVPPQFRNSDHDSRFSCQEGMRRAVIHDPGAPGYGPLELGKLSPQEKASITKLVVRREFDLLFAFRVLR